MYTIIKYNLSKNFTIKKSFPFLYCPTLFPIPQKQLHTTVLRVFSYISLHAICKWFIQITI